MRIEMQNSYCRLFRPPLGGGFLIAGEESVILSLLKELCDAVYTTPFLGFHEDSRGAKKCRGYVSKGTPLDSR